MKFHVDKTVVIEKNEDSDSTAQLRIKTNVEKGTVTLYKIGFGNANTETEFPEQFLHDVIKGFKDIAVFVDGKVSRDNAN